MRPAYPGALSFQEEGSAKCPWISQVDATEIIGESDITLIFQVTGPYKQFQMAATETSTGI